MIEAILSSLGLRPLIPIRAMFDSSCPRLSRASTSRMTNGIKDMDGRDKPGHDEGEAPSVMKVGITYITTTKLHFAATGLRVAASRHPCFQGGVASVSGSARRPPGASLRPKRPDLTSTRFRFAPKATVGR